MRAVKRVALVIAVVGVVACRGGGGGGSGSGSGNRSGSGSGNRNGSGNGSGSGSAIAYRTDASGWHVNPGLVATGKTDMVVSESALATAVGKQVLASGGNAIDAVVATELALAVVHPTAGNLAGGGFAVVRASDGTRSALDFRETAPAAATRDMFLDAAGKPDSAASTVGYKAVATPATVAGLYELHRKLGKKPWRDVVAPAIALARAGFAIDAYTHEALARRAACLAKFPASAALWLPDGKARAADANMTQPRARRGARTDRRAGRRRVHEGRDREADRRRDPSRRRARHRRGPRRLQGGVAHAARDSPTAATRS